VPLAVRALLDILLGADGTLTPVRRRPRAEDANSICGSAEYYMAHLTGRFGGRG
jgi:hypothetical protein